MNKLDLTHEEEEQLQHSYDQIDFYDEGVENDKIRDLSQGITPCDGNYSLDDLPF